MKRLIESGVSVNSRDNVSRLGDCTYSVLIFKSKGIVSEANQHMLTPLLLEQHGIRTGREDKNV